MSDARRITRLEEKLTHVEHDLAQLDQVVREIADRMADLSSDMGQIHRAMSGLTDKIAASQPPPDPEEEKPPHW